MEDLIKALTILLKYGNPRRPTHCEHDELTISSEIDPRKVSEEDLEELGDLGFKVEGDYFCSFRFGSC